MVGQFINQNCVACYQQVGTFTKLHVPVDTNEKHPASSKVGGNVVSYFCTPDGKVITALVGPARAGEVLKEGKFAVKQYAKLKSEEKLNVRKRLIAPQHYWQIVAYQTAIQDGDEADKLNKQIEVHTYLAKQPLQPLDDVYRHFFQQFANEAVNDAALEELRDREVATRTAASK